MLVDVLLAATVGAALLVAAALKVLDRTDTAIGAATFGLGGRLARHVWLPLAAIEAGLAVAVLAGSAAGALAAAALLGAFAIAQAGALAAGRGGAPCGCFGARGHLSAGSAARTALLAALALAVALSPEHPPVIAAALAIPGAAIAVARTRVDGALEIAGEGPSLGSRPALPGGARLALFTADGCHLCRRVRPYAERLGADVYDETRDAGAWAAAAVPGAPFAVALASDGTVLAKGTVNTRRQLASLMRAAAARRSDEASAGSRARAAETAAAAAAGSDRRGFLARAGGAAAALTAGPLIGAVVAPGEAGAYHFCGHIYTTDGCPHPTGLPRIDSRGYPLRARDGKPVDDLGRLVDAAGAPIDEAGAPLLDPDGRPQPAATRTRVCTAAGRRFRINVRVDGSWHRCCNGQVRKLVDCCSTSPRRINGDRALRGYCYARRKVFCVMFFQTRIPC